MTNFANEILTSRLGGTHLFYAGQAGFIIKSSTGQTLAIDLFLSNCLERTEGHVGFKRLLPQILRPEDIIFDVVICTHPHFDHFDIDSIPHMIDNGKTKLFCSVECDSLVKQLQLEYYKENITYVKPMEKYSVGDFEIDFINCDHGTGAPDAVGVIVRVDNKIICEVGDTCLRLDRINEIPNPLNILIGPINGAYGNLNESELAVLAENVRPGMTIPCHYGMVASHHGDVGIFYEIMKKKNLPFHLMRMGEHLTL